MLPPALVTDPHTEGGRTGAPRAAGKQCPQSREAPRGAVPRPHPTGGGRCFRFKTEPPEKPCRLITHSHLTDEEPEALGSEKPSGAAPPHS